VPILVGINLVLQMLDVGPEKADPIFPSLTAPDLQRASREAPVLDA